MKRSEFQRERVGRFKKASGRARFALIHEINWIRIICIRIRRRRTFNKTAAAAIFVDEIRRN